MHHLKNSKIFCPEGPRENVWVAPRMFSQALLWLSTGLSARRLGVNQAADTAANRVWQCRDIGEHITRNLRTNYAKFTQHLVRKHLTTTTHDDDERWRHEAWRRCTMMTIDDARQRNVTTKTWRRDVDEETMHDETRDVNARRRRTMTSRDDERQGWLQRW